MIRRLIFSLAVIAGLGLFDGSAAYAAGGSNATTTDAKPKDAEYEMAKKAVNNQDWKQAIALLTRVVGRDQNNADAHNFLGYSYRKSGNPDQALTYYKIALQIDPKHKGAHEYIGEAYLETRNLEMAEQHLKELDNLCLFGCQEFTDLKNAIQAYKKIHNIGS